MTDYYWFGGAPGARTSDGYIEDVNGNRLANLPFTVVNAADGTTITDLLDQNGQPATQVTTDENGYYTFAAPVTVVNLSGGAGTFRAYSSSAVSDVISALPQLDGIQASAAASAFSAKQAQAAAEAAVSGATAPAATAITSYFGGDATGLIAAVAAKAGKGDVVVNAKDYGTKGDGASDDSAALTSAFAAGVAAKLPVQLSGDYALASDLTISSRISAAGPVTFRAATAPTVNPTLKVTVGSHVDLRNVTFVGVIVILVPSSGGVTSLDGCLFKDSSLTVGADTTPVQNVRVSNCDFTTGLGRTFNAVTLVNASGVELEGNRVQEFGTGLVVNASISFAARKISLTRNTFTNCTIAVSANGSSLARISNLGFKRNTITASNRTTATGLKLTYCTKVTLEDNTVATAIPVRADACLEVTASGNNRITGTKPGTHAVSLFGCAGWKFLDNTFTCGVGSYAILATSAAFGTAGIGNPYPPQDLIIARNRFVLAGQGMKIENTTGVRVLDNDFTGTVALAAGAGFVWFAGTTVGKYLNNKFTAPSGTPVVVAGTATGASTEPQTLTVATPTKSVAAPVITASDPDLNGAKSYVVTFTLSDVSLLHQLADDDNFKTLSSWMTGVTGATLAWNSSAWNLNSLNLGDIVADGAIYDNAGTEDYWSMKSAVVVDRYNRLTSRNWYQLPTVADRPDGVSSAMVEELAWQAATFRPPLVVDGAVYDAVATGLTWTALQNTDLSGRMSLGQKADGTYVLVAVDGATNVSGCTLVQLAAKHVALGSVHAFNFDSGGSVTLWYNGSVINSPSDAAGQRALPAVMYV